MSCLAERLAPIAAAQLSLLSPGDRIQTGRHVLLSVGDGSDAFGLVGQHTISVVQISVKLAARLNLCLINAKGLTE